MALVFYVVSLIPSGSQVTEMVDVIEINHFVVNHMTGETMTQYIFWRWDLDGFRIVDWRWYRGRRPVWNGCWWVLVFRDRKILRKISSCELRETWTLHDPEVERRRTGEWRELLIPQFERGQSCFEQ